MFHMICEYRKGKLVLYADHERQSRIIDSFFVACWRCALPGRSFDSQCRRREDGDEYRSMVVFDALIL